MDRRTRCPIPTAEDELTSEHLGQFLERLPDYERKLDALFANSSAETKTSTEKAFLQGFVNQVGDVGAIMVAILVAVLFSILLVTANTMAQAVRERTNELAVLKTLGEHKVSIHVGPDTRAAITVSVTPLEE